MNILVTGAGGLVGRALQCVEHPFDYNLYGSTRQQCDLAERGAASRLIEHQCIDAVIHLAAKVGGIQANMENQMQMLNQNLRINANVIESALASNVPRVLAIASTCIFPHRALNPLRVCDLHSGEPHPTNYGYAYAKRMLCVQCQAANQMRLDVSYQPVIPCNLYGPGDNFHLKDSHVIPAIIHKMWLAKQINGPLRLLGDGNASREFMFSLDFARVLIALAGMKLKEPLIVSPPNPEVTVAELADLIAQEMDFAGKIHFEGGENGIRRKTSDNTEFLNLFNRMEFTPLSDGIRQTVRWFTANYPENIRR